VWCISTNISTMARTKQGALNTTAAAKLAAVQNELKQCTNNAFDQGKDAGFDQGFYECCADNARLEAAAKAREAELQETITSLKAKLAEASAAIFDLVNR